MTKGNVLSGYVLVTPARNEEDLIPRTIDSIASQTIRPLRWIIVNDGSTDGTREIVESRTSVYPFIRLININRTGQRNFGSKAYAFMEGIRNAQDLSYQFIGNLDADICLEPNYYQGILGKFAEDPELGIAGGIVYTKVKEEFVTSDTSTHSVGGAVQLFRRECLRDVGGYMSLDYGGEDAAAEIKARMFGWKVQKFLDFKVIERRRTGSAEATPIGACICDGRRFHSLGYGWLFYLLRAVYRFKDPPAVIGSLATLYGYLRSCVRREPILIPHDMQEFLKTEQRERIINVLVRKTIGL